MKPITLPAAELKPALTGLAKVINTRSTLPVLSNIKVERTSDGWIALTSTDLDRWVTVRLEHPAEGPPSTVMLPYDQLSQVVKSCGKGENIEVTSTEDTSIIRFPLGDTLGESKVSFISPDEFPKTPKLKSESIPLPSGLRESLLEAMECASNDQTRYVLNGTFIDSMDPKANYIVATDGKHLYSANSFTLPLKDSVIIPIHKFLAWKEFNGDGEWQMRVGDQHLQLSTRRWRFITKTIEGKYPDWRTPIPDPSTIKTSIALDPSKLDTLIKLIQRMPCHDDTYHTLGLEWKEGHLMLMGKDKPQDEWLRVPVPDVKGEGPDMTLYLNRIYLIKGLGFGMHVISLIDPQSPIRLHSGGKQLIVMPVRDNAGPPPEPTAPQPPVDATPPNPNSPPTTAAQPTPPPPMQTPPRSHEQHPPAAAANGSTTSVAANTNKQETKSGLETALVHLESIKTSYREACIGLSKLGDSLRAAMREQRASEKEIQGVRQTLRSLQGVRI
ncbi:DNA polymerase III subunit beta [Roseimicrobium sp. ORNL1]|uniref:DNA polymerase III subunit beta n=1 Tax=Roseimicrobium sp. ORNL1 TaxID=2711231 RepID=UPI0013E1E6C5|nr:DNA polymerase III subunit beta [Roseimicrobium sp. ORNL1]QIF02842.1 DNA polymerase III subunit beta [Roseimicrobium sp. ORNL1]